MRRLVCVCALVACGAPPATVVQNPVVPSAVKPAPPRAARWALASRPRKATDVLEIAPGLALHVGDHGRRVLVSGDHATDAEVLAPETLGCAMRDPSGAFVFVGERGGVYVSRDALGDFTAVRSAPPHDGELRAIARGRAAILALAEDGKVMRSTDYGASWQPASVDGAASVALDRNGNGVLVQLPQRVFVTHDDGATWTPIAAPEAGARRVIHDEEDRLFVQGYARALSRLEGDAFVASGPLASKEESGAMTDSTASSHARVFAGDHVVELDTEEGSVAIRTGRTFEKTHGTPAPEIPKNARVRIASDGATVYLLVQEQAAATILASTDFGATWTSLAKLEDEAERSSYEPFVAGPKGWLYVPGGRRRVRAAGASQFEERTSTVSFEAKSFAFDERNDKVYALGTHDGKLAIYEARLSQTTFAPIAMSVPEARWIEPALSVDDAGTLHVVTYDPTKNAYRFQRRDVHGLELPTTYVPIWQLTNRGSVATPAFAGARGLLAFDDAWAWETADGGDHWTRVGSPGAFEPRCSDVGCLSARDATMRIGWDLPAISTRGEVIEARAEIDSREERRRRSDRITFAPPPPMTFACKPAAPAVSMSSMPRFDTLGAGEARWAVAREEKDGATTLLVGERTTVRQVHLLPAAARASKGEPSTTGEWVDGGYVSGRFTPASIELAWYSHAAGRSFVAKLPPMPNVSIGSHEKAPGLDVIVEGGLLYRPASDGPTFFLREDGHVEQLALPAHATIEKSVRWGKQWLLVDRDDGMALVSWSLDDGKTWGQRAWALEESLPSVVFAPQHAWFTFERGGAISLVALTPLPPKTEIPAAVPVDLAASVDAACDPKAPWSRALEMEAGDTVHGELALKAGSVQLVATNRLERITSSPSLCNAGYVLRDHERKHATVVHRDREWTGWTFDSSVQSVTATPIACTVAK